MKTTKITKLALIATATAAVSHRRVRLQSRAVKMIGLLSAVAAAACVHTTAICQAGPTTPAPTPGSRAVTFEYLMRAPVPTLCEHDPGNLRNGELPPQEGHRGDVKIALNYDTGAYKVAFGDLTGGAGDAAMVTDCSAGGVPWAETVQLYPAYPSAPSGGKPSQCPLAAVSSAAEPLAITTPTACSNRITLVLAGIARRSRVGRRGPEVVFVVGAGGKLGAVSGETRVVSRQPRFWSVRSRGASCPGEGMSRA
jgi:hypothetical protein